MYRWAWVSLPQDVGAGASLVPAVVGLAVAVGGGGGGGLTVEVPELTHLRNLCPRMHARRPYKVLRTKVGQESKEVRSQTSHCELHGFHWFPFGSDVGHVASCWYHIATLGDPAYLRRMRTWMVLRMAPCEAGE